MPQSAPAERPARNRWFSLLVALSLGFLVLALYRGDYLAVPRLYSVPALLLCVPLLFVGCLGQALAWWALLRQTEYRATIGDCIAGMGLSVFTKYIPGKVLVIVGRAAYLAERHGQPLGRLSMLSLIAQLMSLWAGLTLGALGLLLIGSLGSWRWLVGGFWLALSVAVFSDVAQVSIEPLLRRVARRDVRLPRFELKAKLAMLPWFVGFWSCWAISFYLLLVAIQPGGVTPEIGLGFPLAAALGIVAVVAPGGLGVQEGVLVGFLVLAGFDLAAATSASVVTRLWFLLGETFLFMVGWLAHRRRRPTR